MNSRLSRAFRSALVAFLAPAALAQVPVLPIRIGGTLTVDGQLVTAGTADTYEFRVEPAGGSGASPVAVSTGLTVGGGYAVDIPSYDPVVQPGGVRPGTALVLRVLRNGTAVTLAQPADGAFTAGAAGTLTTVNVAIGSGSARLINLSTRGLAGVDDRMMFAGFVIAGSGEKRLLIRGIGPALVPFGVANALAAPRIRLMRGGTPLDVNAGWSAAPNAAAIQQTAIAVGAFALPNGSADSALLVSLPAGQYTVQLSGQNATPGIGLAELYDAGGEGSARLVNISSRAFVGTGEAVLIPGCVVGGAGSARLLVRGVGPALAAFGVTSVLADPRISVRQDSTVLAANDNWSDSAEAAAIGAASSAVGAFALEPGSRDAVLLVTVPTGNYTVQVEGVGNTTGIALVEVYEVR